MCAGVGGLGVLKVVNMYLDVPGRKLGSMVCKWDITYL